MTGPDRKAIEATIRRLRAERTPPDADDIKELADAMEELIAEIDKLEDAEGKICNDASKQVLALAAERDQLRAEIERMQAVVDAAGGEVSMMIDPELAAAILDGLSWREDMIITNHFGEVVWLRPLYVDADFQDVPAGSPGARRYGITDCCLAENPCDHHAALAPAQRSGTA